MKNVEPLNDAAHTPQLVLARTTAKLQKMTGVIVLMKWDTGGWAADWSKMSLSDMLFAREILSIKIQDAMHDNYDPEFDHYPKEEPTDVSDNRSERADTTAERPTGEVVRLPDGKRKSTDEEFDPDPAA